MIDQQDKISGAKTGTTIAFAGYLGDKESGDGISLRSSSPFYMAYKEPRTRVPLRVLLSRDFSRRPKWRTCSQARMEQTVSKSE